MPGNPFESAGTERFRVIRRLGEGGMGKVYEVQDRERGCRVALKTVRDMDGSDLLRLRNEFRALQDLHHPNLVRLDELLEDGGRLFFTMELVDGATFIEHVRPDARSGHPPESDAAIPSCGNDGTEPLAAARGFDEGRLRSALAQLALGLFFVHSSGKIHRDIKPSNILVRPDGRVVAGRASDASTACMPFWSSTGENRCLSHPWP